MHPDLKTRHRLFVQASQSYAVADRAWRIGLRNARSLVPIAVSSKVSTLGAPGSRIRKLYEDREKALQRFQVAHVKFDIARARIAQQQ
ncbi:hypothetical protein BXY66_0004 [Shimia isoporae]|uniref:Uncharacterized protein n=1 Tax=Shimia isoporae TaxID=647720 RepID=A0A4R1NN72_9RHOB|nr:hypothetical protein [Shimia isoporae]TCL07973.1 hypothetical protein BXY66_0004 [Shimia isoporae]